MPSNRSTATPVDVAGLLGIGVAQDYINSENWISEQQVGTRATDELSVIKQAGKDMAAFLADPDCQKAFLDGFTTHYTANAPVNT